MFENGYENQGLDYAAYDATTQKWLRTSFPCYKNLACSNYDQTTGITHDNFIDPDLESPVSHTKYGMVQFGFDSGTAADLNLFRGNCGGNTPADQECGVISMRHVRFPEKFQSSFYVGEQLLDFLIYHSYDNSGSQDTIQATLVNAYTISNTKLRNLKISFVNAYYDTAVFNTGEDYPTFLRIGGGILNEESQGADQIGIFFDHSVTLENFYEDEEKSNQVACSEKECLFFQHKGVNSNQDCWFNNPGVEIILYQNIVNEFNILVPLRLQNFPFRMVIVFAQSSLSANGVDSLRKVLQVYRITGPIIQQKFGTMTDPFANFKINGASQPPSAFGSQSSYFYGSPLPAPLEYKIQIANIYQNSQSETKFAAAGLCTDLNFTGYGAGVTIVSKHFNIFEKAKLYYQNVSKVVDCAIVGYKYTAGAGVVHNNYAAFCPIDSSTDLTKYPDIVLQDPVFSQYFGVDYPLASILRYTVTDGAGNLVLYNPDPQTIVTPNTDFPKCRISNNLYTLMYTTDAAAVPISSINQIFAFNISLNSDLDLDSNIKNGFASFIIDITMVNSTKHAQPWTTADIQSYGACSIASSDGLPYSCAVDLTQAKHFYIKVDPPTGQWLKVKATQSFRVQFYIKLLNSNFYGLTHNASINAQIFLPFYDTGLSKARIFGNAGIVQTPARHLRFAECTHTSYLNITNNNFITKTELANLDFSAKNPRMASSFKIQFVLKQRSTIDLNEYIEFSLLNLRDSFLQSALAPECYIMEKKAGESDRVSWHWGKFTYDLTVAGASYLRFYPKSIIQDPNGINFLLYCSNILNPTLYTNMLSLSAFRTLPSLLALQTISAPYSYAGSVNMASFTLVPTLNPAGFSLSKKYQKVGAEGFYSFKMKVNSLLTEMSRVYLQFDEKFLPYLNKEGVVECYIDTKKSLIPIQTNCEFFNARQLKIQITEKIAPLTEFQIDIYHITEVESLTAADKF